MSSECPPHRPLLHHLKHGVHVLIADALGDGIDAVLGKEKTEADNRCVRRIELFTVFIEQLVYALAVGVFTQPPQFLFRHIPSPFSTLHAIAPLPLCEGQIVIVYVVRDSRVGVSVARPLQQYIVRNRVCSASDGVGLDHLGDVGLAADLAVPFILFLVDEYANEQTLVLFLILAEVELHGKNY